MPEFDVATRLVEGLPAIDDLHTYVLAAQARGYQDADLTLPGAQPRDWYGTEDGLDLGVLDADCAALRAAADTGAEALGVLRAQMGALSRAWSGPGAAACVDFVGRHNDSAATLVRAVDSAARACVRLRDELWRTVDEKVAATIAMAGRAQPNRDRWLAAARAVLAGDGSEAVIATVDDEVCPFVESMIGVEWVSAMRSARAAVSVAYRGALDAVAGLGAVRFEVPGDLGPRYVAPRPRVQGTYGPVGPTSLGGSTAFDPLEGLTGPDAPGGVWPEPAPLSGAQPAAAPAGFTPTGAVSPGASGGLDSLATIPQRIADALGRLFETAGGAMPSSDPPGLEPPELEADPPDTGVSEGETPELPDDVEEPDAAGDLDGTEDADDIEDSDDTEEPDDIEDPDAAEDTEAPDGTGDPDDPGESDQPPPAEPVAPPIEPSPEPAPAPAVTTAPPGPEPATPCELAADELPQAGP